MNKPRWRLYTNENNIVFLVRSCYLFLAFFAFDNLVEKGRVYSFIIQVHGKLVVDHLGRDHRSSEFLCNDNNGGFIVHQIVVMLGLRFYIYEREWEMRAFHEPVLFLLMSCGGNKCEKISESLALSLEGWSRGDAEVI
jgi:hypothetical protein